MALSVQHEAEPAFYGMIFATTAADGKVYQVEYYNLDMVLSVGYRVKSSRGIECRRWANKVLKEYLLKDHAINYRLGIHTYKKCHDRFLIIDGTDIYHIGASLKDLGNAVQANLTAIAEACAFFDRLENKRNNGMEHTGQSFFYTFAVSSLKERKQYGNKRRKAEGKRTGSKEKPDGRNG